MAGEVRLESTRREGNACRDTVTLLCQLLDTNNWKSRKGRTIVKISSAGWKNQRYWSKLRNRKTTGRIPQRHWSFASMAWGWSWGTRNTWVVSWGEHLWYLPRLLQRRCTFRWHNLQTDRRCRCPCDLSWRWLCEARFAVSGDPAPLWMRLWDTPLASGALQRRKTPLHNAAPLGESTVQWTDMLVWKVRR